MPSTSKEEMNHTTNDTETVLAASQEPVDTNTAPAKPTRTRRKPAQRKTNTQTKTAASPVEGGTVEATEGVEVVEDASMDEHTTVSASAEHEGAADVIEDAISADSIEAVENIEPESTDDVKTDATELEPTSTEEVAKLPDKLPEQEGKFRKKTIKKTHSKEKVYIQNDLLKQLKAATKGKGKGYRTKFINDALEKALNELDN